MSFHLIPLTDLISSHIVSSESNCTGPILFS